MDEIMADITEPAQDAQASREQTSDVINDIKEDDVYVDATWKSLFAFTTKAHIPVLCAGLLLSTASGIVVPAFSYFLGKIFDTFADFGEGKTTGHDLVHKNTQFAIYLTGLGGVSWVLNGSFFVAWLVFGELQAQSARDQLFFSMLQKDMAWYDTIKAGIGASISRQQT